MLLKAFEAGPLATNAYLLADGLEAFIFDPAPDSAPLILSALKEHNLTPMAIYLTHSHWDHIADIAELKTHYNLPVYVHHLDKQNLELPGSDGIPVPFVPEPITPDGLVAEGAHITLGSLTIEVIHTPGHTPGGVCYWLPHENILLAGDTLFKGSIGALHFPGADPSAMWNSLKKLAKLPKATIVYPGHGQPTTIGDEPWLDRAQELFQ